MCPDFPARVYPDGYPCGLPARVVLFHICGAPARDGTKSLLPTYIFLRRHHGSRELHFLLLLQRRQPVDNAIFTLLLHRRQYNLGDLGKRKHRRRPTAVVQQHFVVNFLCGPFTVKA